MASTSVNPFELKDAKAVEKKENKETQDTGIESIILETTSIKDVEFNISSVGDEYINSKLKCLEKLDQLCIKKGIKLGLSQTVVHTEIYDNQNRKIFQVKEQTDQSCSGCCYSPNRWLDMDIINSCDEEILHLTRDKGTSCSWISCNLPTLEIYLSPKYKIGKMKGVTGIYPVKYNIEDEIGNCIFKIRSGFSFPYLYFNVLSSDKSSIIGKISRDRPQSHHVFSRHYSVHVLFPVELQLKMKAILLGAALLLMSSHFEDSE